MFKAIGFLLNIYPVVMVLISVVEAMMSDRSGEEKKAIVLRAIQDIAAKTGIKVSDSFIKLISQVVDAVVTVLNLMGVFDHKSEGKEEAPVVTASGKVVAPVVIESDTERKLQELEELLTAK